MPTSSFLLAAINGLTDGELSLKLGITLNAVKKRWISIFDRTIEAQAGPLSSYFFE